MEENTQKEIIKKTTQYVKQILVNSESGHDWWHIQRVYNTAKQIGIAESANMFVVELGALLHDIADHKFHDGDHGVGARKTREFLQKLNVAKNVVNQVCHIVENISFSGGVVLDTLEGKCVQDADRLDALGAVGIARCMCYTGHVNRSIHNPEDKNSKSAINHFYEKLLILKDKMNTASGLKMAEQRHKYMEDYLTQFYLEWKGKL